MDIIRRLVVISVRELRRRGSSLKVDFDAQFGAAVDGIIVHNLLIVRRADFLLRLGPAFAGGQQQQGRRRFPTKTVLTGSRTERLTHGQMSLTRRDEGTRRLLRRCRRRQVIMRYLLLLLLLFQLMIGRGCLIELMYDVI